MNTHHPLTLFIVKKFYEYDGRNLLSNGLGASAQFVVDFLMSEGRRALLVEAIDANCIDRLVTVHRPRRVVLEALWVTPEKLSELHRLHPHIEWVVRIHSELPFLANEGQAMAWILAYGNIPKVQVAFNSEQTKDDLDVFGWFAFLPNYYPQSKPRKIKPPCDHIDVGCFGAIRPLKNQLVQAVAAIRFGDIQQKKVRFHLNGYRVEQSGNNNLKNIEALFAASDHELVQHPWLDRPKFLELVAEMHICLQVSLSESFNVVSADAASLGVPLIGSSAVHWLPERSTAPVDSATAIADAMLNADAINVAMNQEALKAYLKRSAHIWLKWVD